ncbi:SseB family protein [Frankia sp. Cpl3]|uniref:SseB family protein n=1 Tax=Parafrankia colletiae TaxID=573497 RepID=UPI0009FD3C95|nr:SseB family protein [Parafrankia colletiae]MCK9904388.1 SseB family protein [Frankia sp. Cpl3]
MTDHHDGPVGFGPGGTTPASEALHRLALDRDDSAALGALAVADVLVPDLSDPSRDNGDARVVKLPVAEQADGRQFVPTFTSERRLADALPGVGRYRRVALAVLLRMWPSEDLMLAVDPGTEEGLTFPAEGIRALAALAD